MNEYQIAFTFSGCIAALWVGAYLLAWAWAWVDDSEVNKGSWPIEALTKRVTPEVEWIHPVYLDDGDPPFGYARDKKYGGATIHKLRNVFGYTLEAGTHYQHCGEVKARGTVRLFKAVLGVTASPVLLLVSFKFYPVAIGAATFYCVAHLTRYARRHKKLFDAHVKEHRT